MKRARRNLVHKHLLVVPRQIDWAINIMPLQNLVTSLTLPLVEPLVAQTMSPDVFKKFDASMLHISGRAFTMGCTAEQAVMNTQPSAFENCPEYPVETVSLRGATNMEKMLGTARTVTIERNQ